MSSTLPIRIESGRFPINYSPSTAKQFFRDMLSRTRMVVPDNKVFIGVDSNLFPTYDAGFHITAGRVDRWAGEFGSYAPLNWSLRNGDFAVALRYEATNDFVVRFGTFPDKSGTVALLIDTYVPRETQLPIGSGTVTINGALSDSFFFKLSSNVTMGTITVLEGQKIFIGILNIGTAYTVDWTGTSVLWPAPDSNSSPPTQPTAAPGGSGFGFYILRGVKQSGVVVIYGEFLDNSPFQPSGTVDVGGAPPKNYGGSGSGYIPPVERQKNLP